MRSDIATGLLKRVAQSARDTIDNDRQLVVVRGHISLPFPPER